MGQLGAESSSWGRSGEGVVGGWESVVVRRNLVTIFASAVAIFAAIDNIRTKREAAALLEREPVITRINGIPTTVEKQQELIDKLKARIHALQGFVADRGLHWEQPSPDDGLQEAGVYPQLIYDRSMK